MIDFEKFIDQFLNRERRPKEIGRYYPSEAGLCMRHAWYSYKFPRETEKELLRIFHVGNLVHDFVVDVFKSERTTDVELVEAELPFKIKNSDFMISGRIDDLVMLKENKKKVLVEVKSCRSVSSLSEPENTHKMQLQLYMHATGIHNGVLLYIEKNTLKSKSFDVGYDKDWADRIIDRFGALDKHLKANIIPPAEGKRIPEMQQLCSKCDYADLCSKDGNDDGDALPAPVVSYQNMENKVHIKIPDSKPVQAKNGRLSDFIGS